MSRVSATTTVPVSTEEAFNFIADYRNIPHVQPHFGSARIENGIERGMGAVVELRGRYHGIPLTVHQRIITFTPPSRIVSISQGAVLSRSTWEFEPEGSNSTRVTLTIDYKLGDTAGGLLKGVGAAIWPVFQREIQGMTEDSMRRLLTILTGDYSP